MSKIRSITFNNHPVLKNLSLNFCDNFGKAVDTVIIAGENGCGKSTLLNCLYAIASGKIDFECSITLEKESKNYDINYKRSTKGQLWEGKIRAKCEGVFEGLPDLDNYKRTFGMYGIFSDVDINFHGQNISAVTSLSLDAVGESRRSNTDLPKHIKQLLIDIQAQDDADISQACIDNPNTPYNMLNIERRIPRFTKAFDEIFEDLSYSRVVTNGGQKNVIFEKYTNQIRIDDLSSGEKQVVYRGCFLLKDINALNGAFVFIDEPEISLHPNWQKKIMDYYKGIFTNSNGEQTSQIFAVTHSPFIIHNENRKNDKVIVLARDDNGEIIVKDKPEYFKCDSMAVVKDAFFVHGFSSDKSIVYLEGRTDEKYFKKAVEVFDFSDLSFEFKWIGSLDEKGQEINTGKDALNKAVPFLVSQDLPYKNICLYDCDANKPQKQQGNVISFSIPKFDNDKSIGIGIENALIFEDIDIEPYKKQHVEVDGYGIEKRIPDFQKMACCDYICSLERERLQRVFVNLKAVIENLIALFKE